jgi:general L-amino acid transport system substrate-binding protein
MKTHSLLLAAVLLAISAPAASAASGDTLAGVKERGFLACPGHNGSYPGMAEVDDQGRWRGFDIDLCRALATAIFGTEAEHLRILPTSFAQRWPMLQSGELDVMIKSTTWTLSRDTDTGLQFSNVYMMTPNFYAVHTDSGIATAKELDGGTVCVQAGTSLERNIVEHAEANNYKLTIVPFETTEAAKAAFLQQRCDAYMDNNVQLGAMRNNEVDDPESITVLPDMITASPLAIAMLEGDEQWVDINNWLLSVLLQADQAGVTSQNVDAMKASPPAPAIAKLLGVTPGVGTVLGLSDDWGYNVIKAVGNYDEIWERNLGKGSVYGLERGVNSLMRNGGVLYPLVMD